MHNLAVGGAAGNRVTIERQDHVGAIRVFNEGPVAAGPRDVDPCAGEEEFRAERLPHPDGLVDARVIVHLGGLVGLAFPADARREFDAERDFVGVAGRELGLQDIETR